MDQSKFSIQIQLWLIHTPTFLSLLMDPWQEGACLHQTTIFRMTVTENITTGWLKRYGDTTALYVCWLPTVGETLRTYV